MLDTFCLALVIYVEARGEPIDGQLMVANVVINRVKHEWWPDDTCSVVFEPDQFSGIDADLDLESIFEDPSWKHAVLVAGDALSGNTVGIEATHYHTTDIKPTWSEDLTLLGQYGNHVFYREDER